jgi:hypothetical protein
MLTRDILGQGKRMCNISLMMDWTSVSSKSGRGDLIVRHAPLPRHPQCREGRAAERVVSVAVNS